ncbi:MAG: hypothetical protein V4505_01420 [Pseudomonadota bacterium]
MPIYKTDNKPFTGPHVLDKPPPFHELLCRYGERPYWSPDGQRIAFIENNYGDVCEMDFRTREVRNLTKGLGEHHSFLRVLYLPNGDYLFIGPKVFKDRHTSRHLECEIWLMDKSGTTPPVPLGLKIAEGMAVSAGANRFAYATHGGHDARIGGMDDFECHVIDLDYRDGKPVIASDRVVYRNVDKRRPEPQDFRHGDSELIFAEYLGSRTRDDGRPWSTVTRGIDLASLDVRTYVSEPLTHNECEGIFPDHEHICLETSCDFVNQFPPIDLWKLKLDGSGRRVRMTQLFDHAPWRASNSNISPDGRWMAFMVNTYTSEPGFGMGLGLFDLEAWSKSPQAQEWETPAERAALRAAGKLPPEPVL